ncbi:MAG: sugar-binding transcriptional regulator [Propioniciclava sp.]
MRAATLYYLDGMSQAEVAKAIGVSRPNVSRVLAEARRSGIIEISITITDTIGRAAELEHALRRQFALTDVRVARGGDDDLARIGRLGADWLLSALPERGRLSLAWGSSVQAVVDAVQSEQQFPDLEVLPLVGGLATIESEQDGNVLVRELAARIGANDRRLNAPALVETVDLCRALLAEPRIASVLADGASADIAVVGVGAVGSGSSAAIVNDASLAPAAAAAFMASGVVGDCCTRYFDATGTPVPSPIDDRVVGVRLEDLRRAGTVVAVAAGSRKVESVRAALHGHWFDVLIVDEPLARALLT